MNLDTPEKFTQLDKNRVLESIENFGDQAREAWGKASKLVFPEEFKTVKNVVVCGMGGSRFTPRAIKELFKEELKVPYEICEDYSVPGYVNSDTLVILSSYSGTTEEVIAAGRMAQEKGAKITGISAGGDVQKMVEESGSVGYFFTPGLNPSGQPRLGSGYMILGHLGIIYSLGLIDLKVEEVDKAITKVVDYKARYLADIPSSENEAKRIANELSGKHVFVVTAEFLKGFGNGFANQINENAKNISDPRFISELNHHLLEGLKYPESLKDSGIFVLINSSLYSEPIKKRFKITKDVVEKNGLATYEINLTGQSRIDQLLEGFTLSGFATYYMALLKDLDPVLIPWVDYFKEQLKKS